MLLTELAESALSFVWLAAVTELVTSSCLCARQDVTFFISACIS